MIQLYNEDCYEGIKKIPDKSVDLVYIDIPYLYSNFGERIVNTGKLKNNNIKHISNGIDFKIFDELIRVMKHIYIYIYGVVNNKLKI